MRLAERIGIVGLGHIGGSLAASLGASCPVIAYDLESRSRTIARSSLAVEVVESLGELVKMADTFVVATPTPSVAQTIEEIDRLSCGLGIFPLVIDVASVKHPFTGLSSHLGNARYLGMHPMAGREGSGVDSADGSLFANSRWAICLSGGEDDSDVASGAAVAFAAGASVLIGMSAEVHDQVVALTSNLPHALAFALAKSMLDSPVFPQARWMVGGSFRDGTRVARSNPERVAEMLEPNGIELGKQLDRFIGYLGDLQDAIMRRDCAGWLAAAEAGTLAAADSPLATSAVLVKSGSLASQILSLGESGVAVADILEIPGTGFELRIATP